MAVEKEEKSRSAEHAERRRARVSMKLVIVGAVALFVALVGAQVAVPLINGMIAGGSHAAGARRRRGAASEEVADEVAAAEEEAARSEEPLAPALYTRARSAVRRELRQEDGARYLQLHAAGDGAQRGNDRGHQAARAGHSQLRAVQAARATSSRC